MTEAITIPSGSIELTEGAATGENLKALEPGDEVTLTGEHSGLWRVDQFVGSHRGEVVLSPLCGEWLPRAQVTCNQPRGHL